MDIYNIYGWEICNLYLCWLSWCWGGIFFDGDFFFLVNCRLFIFWILEGWMFSGFVYVFMFFELSCNLCICCISFLYYRLYGSDFSWEI